MADSKSFKSCYCENIKISDANDFISELIKGSRFVFPDIFEQEEESSESAKELIYNILLTGNEHDDDYVEITRKFISDSLRRHVL